MGSWTLTTTTTLLVLLLALPPAASGSHHDSVVRFDVIQKPDLSKRGYVENCGPGGGYFNISWSPKDIVPTEEIHFYVHLRAPMDLESGRLTATVWYEESPVLSIDKRGSCQDVEAALMRVLPSSIFTLHCPLRKGTPLVAQYTYRDTEQLIGFDGDYKLEARYSNDEGKELLCFRMNVVVLTFP